MMTLQAPTIPVGFQHPHLVNQKPKLEVKLFLDPLCSDCRDVWFPFNKALDSDVNGDVDFTFFYYPLPYFPNSFLLSQGAQVLHRLEGPKSVIDYTHFCLENQEELRKECTTTELRQRVLKEMEPFLSNEGQLRKAEELMKKGSESYRNAVQTWKFGASKAVFEAPTIFVNDVMQMELCQFTSVEKWTDYFEEFHVSVSSNDS